MQGLAAHVFSLALLCSVVGRIGDTWGTNIHWKSETARGEAGMLAKAFKIARMDFTWATIETTCGQYNWESYETLLGQMSAHGIRPYWILDYGNACYPNGKDNGCTTVACIEGFGRFAAATVEKFKGHNIIFECINEPNGMGHDNATDIAALCKAAGGHFKEAGETFVGPTTSTFDWSYLETSFQHGILDAFTGLSVHPYRSSNPETVLEDYARLRDLIKNYSKSSEQANMPVLSGEWGYTSATPPCNYGNRVSEDMQGSYIARMWLTNLMAGVNVSIAYDWRDDGPNATVCEQNFGSVHNTPTHTPEQPFQPKPFYLAALTAQQTVGSMEKYVGRITPTNVSPSEAASRVYVMKFENTTGAAVAAWSSGVIHAGECSDGAPREDCGYSGISKSQCLARTRLDKSCCWDSNPGKQAQCYFVPHVYFPDTTVTFGTMEAKTCYSSYGVTGNAEKDVCSDASGVVTLALGNSTGPRYMVPRK